MVQRHWHSGNRAAAIIMIALSVGCGGADGRLTVGGEVTYDGQAVARGSIGFVPTDPASGRPAGGPIVDGRYKIQRDEGPTAGAYKVVVYAEKPTGRVYQADEGGGAETIEEVVQYLPPLYNDRTTLSVEIDGDREDLDFALDKPKRGKR